MAWTCFRVAVLALTGMVLALGPANAVTIDCGS